MLQCTNKGQMRQNWELKTNKSCTNAHFLLFETSFCNAAKFLLFFSGQKKALQCRARSSFWWCCFLTVLLFEAFTVKVQIKTFLFLCFGDA